MTVLSPVFHVRGLRKIDVSERCVSRIGGAGKHKVLAVDLSWKQHAVAVKGQKCVFALGKRLEIVGIGYTDSGLAVVCVAPSHPVSVLNKAHPGVIAIKPLVHLLGGRVLLDKLYTLLIYFPVDAVI